MRFCIFFFGCIFWALAGCKNPPPFSGNVRGALLLPNFAVATADSGSQIQRFSADGSQSKLLFPKADRTTTQFLPDGLGYLAVSDTSATLVSGVEDYTPLMLPFGSSAIVGAVMPTRGNLLTLDSAGTIDAWQWDQKTDGAAIKLSLPNGNVKLNQGIFTKDGTLVLTLSQGDSIARIWDTKTGKLLYSVPGLSDQVISGAFSPDGKMAVVGTTNGEACWFQNGVFWSVIATFKDHQKGVRSVALSTDHLLMATGDGEGTVRLFGPSSDNTAMLQQTIFAHTGAVSTVAFADDSHHLVSTGEDKAVRVFTLDLGTAFVLDRRASPGHPDRIFTKGFLSQDVNWFLSVSQDNLMRIWSMAAVKTNQHVYQFSPQSEFGMTTTQTNDAILSPEGRYVISAHADSQIRIWDAFPAATPAPKPAMIATLTGHQAAVNSVAVSPDGSLIVSASSDRTARIWQNVSPYPQIGIVKGHTDEVLFAKFSNDGRRLVTTSADRTTKIWDVQDPANPKLLSTMLGHQAAVNTAAFQADGKLLATGGQEGLVNLWDLSDVTNPVLRMGFQAQNKGSVQFAVRSVAISPDGGYLLTGGSDGTSRLWDLTTGRYLASPTTYSYSAESLQFAAAGRRFFVVQGDFVFFRDLPLVQKTTEFFID